MFPGPKLSLVPGSSRGGTDGPTRSTIVAGVRPQLAYLWFRIWGGQAVPDVSTPTVTVSPEWRLGRGLEMEVMTFRVGTPTGRLRCWRHSGGTVEAAVNS